MEASRGTSAARAVDSVVWKGDIGPVAVPQRWGLPDSCLRGCWSLDDRAWMAGAGISAVWQGVAAESPCISGGGMLERCLWGLVGGHSGAH